MGLRIVEIDGLFYPQKKFLFWWLMFNEFDFNIEQEVDISFDSLEAAKDFIIKKYSKDIIKVVWQQGN